MRIDIDFSIFTPTPSSEGVISGKIEVNEFPRVGEMVSFSFAPNESKFPLESGFNPLLKVENVIHNANGQSAAVQLQNLILPNKKSVIEVTAFLEQGFGLFFSPTSE